MEVFSFPCVPPTIATLRSGEYEFVRRLARKLASACRSNTTGAFESGMRVVIWGVDLKKEADPGTSRSRALEAKEEQHARGWWQGGAVF